MTSVNIGRDQADKSYRYKMPVLVTKIEGRGNGIKTVIVNMTDIAKALHTNPEYPTKYFGLELGAQSKYDTKTERAIVNGCHNQIDLVSLLDKFIKEFILCPKCKLPEVKIRVIKTKVQVDCAACGYNGEVASAHKLVGYIQKHQSAEKKAGKKDKDKDKEDKKPRKAKVEGDPEEPATAAEEPEKKEKKKKKPKEEESTENATEASAPKDDSEDKEKKPKKKTADKDTKEKKSSDRKPKKKKDDDDGEWFSDTSKAAQEARRQAEIEEMKNISKAEAVLANSDNKIDDPVQLLRIFLSKKREVSEIVSELRRIQLARGLDQTQPLKILLESLINADEPLKVHSALASNAAVLKKFAVDKNSSGMLISCLEEMVGVTHTNLLARTPHILQALYEADVLSEDAIIAWAEAPPESAWIVKKEVAITVRKKAAPFINWLREAEEDGADEEEEEEEEES